MRGLYVHLPFCLHKCPYCSFYSESGALHKAGAYIRRVLTEASTYPSQAVSSLYFGGGTPTALPAKQLSTLLRGLLDRFPCDGEITMEANPATVTLRDLCTLYEAGVNRISFGVQSLQASELQLLGRIHTAGDAVRAIEDAKKAGFSNISADVMFGLPGQTPSSLSDTLHTLLSLPVTHISTYALSIEEGTPFASMQLALPDDEAERQLFYTLRDTLLQGGYEHYEISNFCRPGMESRHNTLYWTGGEYIGLGAGAHGFYENTRYENWANLDTYLEAQTAIAREEKRTEQDIKEEYYMLGLRMRKGVLDDGNPQIPGLIEAGLLERKDGRVRLTDRGLDIANYVICELFP